MVWTIAVLIVVLAASAVWMTQPVFFVRAPGSTGPAPDRARLERRLRKLVEEFHPRDGGHPENMARAAAWIAEELRRSGAAVSSQPFETAGARYENVVASYGPDSADVVVVGAHYDVAGEMPGADDNASGVAGLLELGDLLSGAKLSRRVDLVAFALEEAPYFATPGMGSEVYASALERSGRRVRAMLCLEMIGCFTDAPGSQGLPFSVLKFLYPTRGDFIAVVGAVGGPGIVRRVKRSMREASALPVCSINAPRFVHGVDLSDHSTFWKRGLPAVMITDTAFYRNSEVSHRSRYTRDARLRPHGGGRCRGSPSGPRSRPLKPSLPSAWLPGRSGFPEGGSSRRAWRRASAHAARPQRSAGLGFAPFGHRGRALASRRALS